MCIGDNWVVADLKTAEIHTAGDSLALILHLNCAELFVNPQGGDSIGLMSQEKFKAETATGDCRSEYQ